MKNFVDLSRIKQINGQTIKSFKNKAKNMFNLIILYLDILALDKELWLITYLGKHLQNAEKIR